MYDNINKLPEEILIHIISRLTHLADLKSVTFVCKWWFSLLHDENYPWKRAYETIWQSIPYQRVHPESWKREYIDRWRQWRRWQYKHPSSSVFLNPDVGSISAIHPMSEKPLLLPSPVETDDAISSSFPSPNDSNRNNNHGYEDWSKGESRFNFVGMETGIIRPCRLLSAGSQAKTSKQTWNCLSPDGLGHTPSCINVDLDDRIICGYSNGDISVVSSLIAGDVSNARSATLIHRHAATATILFICTWKRKGFLSVDSEGFWVYWKWDTSAQTGSSQAIPVRAMQGRRLRPSSAVVGKDLCILGYPDGQIVSFAFDLKNENNVNTINSSPFSIYDQELGENAAIKSLELISIITPDTSLRTFLLSWAMDSVILLESKDSSLHWSPVLRLPSDDNGTGRVAVSACKFHKIDEKSFLLGLGDESGLVRIHHIVLGSSPETGLGLQVISSKEFPGLQGRINCICIDEFHVAAAGASPEIRVWDICSGTCLKSESIYSIPRASNGRDTLVLRDIDQTIEVSGLYCCSGQLSVIAGPLFRYWRFGVSEPQSAHMMHRKGISKRMGKSGKGLIEDRKSVNGNVIPVFANKHEAAREMRKQEKAFRDDQKEEAQQQAAWNRRYDRNNGAHLANDLSEDELIQFAMILSMEQQQQQQENAVDEDADLALALSLAEEDS